MGTGPTLGSVSLSFTGAFQREVSGPGVQEDEGRSEEHAVWSNDVESLSGGTPWTLHLSVDPEPFILLTLGEEGTIQYALDAEKRGWGSLTSADDAYRIDARLAPADDEPGEVRVRGVVELPTWPAWEPEHERVLELLASFGGGRRWATVGAELAIREPRLVSLLVDPDEAEDAWAELRERLPRGWAAFIGDEEEGQAQIACGPVAHPFDVVAWARTSNHHFQYGPAAITHMLGRIAELARFDAMVTRGDAVTLALRDEPADLAALAALVLRFAPEIADDVAELADEIAETRRVHLWWD